MSEPLIPVPLGRAAFAPFGDVLAFDDASARPANEGFALRSDFAAALDHDPTARPILSVYRMTPCSLPLRIDLFERHPQSSQLFMPLTAERFLTVVAETGADGLPDPARARAFLGRRGIGILYRRNLWHAPLMVLGEGGDLLMLIAERGMPDDCIEHRLATSLSVSPPTAEERPL